jgi:RNA polymerase sigma-70 factor (ECF subfamily)
VRWLDGQQKEFVQSRGLDRFVVEDMRVSTTQSQPVGDDEWLDDFYAGRRHVLDRCYREHFETVSKAVGRVLRGADQETVIHEVFLRLLSDESLRRNFAGGSLRSWLATVARHHAIDYRRRRDFEQSVAEAGDLVDATDRFGEAAEARLIVTRFRDEVLPPKWAGVFDARFLAQLDQREAAKRLGISRTTLAYQEHRVRALLMRYLRRGNR